MKTGRPKVGTGAQRDQPTQLVSFASRRSLRAALSARARIILCSMNREPNNAIAACMKIMPVPLANGTANH